jgi:hypothetical protein
MGWRCLAVLAALLVLAGCSSAPGYRQTVPGTFVRVGGPPPGAPFPLPGSITARAAGGQTFTATAGQNGRFKLSLPPGRYRVSGRSPLIQSGQVACAPATPVRVIRGQSPHAITVVCSIS